MSESKIILKVALVFNKKLYEENQITYRTYKFTENNILKELGDLY